jgi:AcrR family transcriptional regulator
MDKRAEQKAKTRKKHIDCALELSATKGFAALSIREVAQAADVTPAAFYRHFRDMEELGLCLVDEIAVSLRRLLRNSRKESMTKDLRGISEFTTESFLVYVNDNSNLFRLLLGERQGASDSFRRAIRKERDIFVVELTEDLERIAKGRHYSLRNPAFAAEAVVTIVFTLGAEALDLPKFKQDNLKMRIVEEVNMIIRGARTRDK